MFQQRFKMEAAIMILQDIPVKGTSRQACSRCGRRIMQLNDYACLVRFLGETSAQRRGFQCMNCRRIACCECSSAVSRCTCGSNAWVATPYLESAPNEALAHAITE
jgi:hypothetical protein